MHCTNQDACSETYAVSTNIAYLCIIVIYSESKDGFDLGQQDSPQLCAAITYTIVSMQNSATSAMPQAMILHFVQQMYHIEAVLQHQLPLYLLI